jgi:hypothetical protein
VNRPPIVRDCTICGHHPGPLGHHYTAVVGDRELHLCHDCWRWDVAAALDTLNIPTTEDDPCQAD